jgi:hypothetical protein
MKFKPSIRTAGWVLAAVVAAPAAFAESHPTPSVMTDTAPLPAQDRQSLGAVILEDSMVPAQRIAFERAGGEERYAFLRNANGETARLQREVELAESAAAADATRVMGGPPEPAPVPQPKKKHRK